MLGPFLAQATTTTTDEVKRMVGEPPAPWAVVLVGAVLLAVILGAGIWARRRRA